MPERLTSAQAAARLQVRTETLYAYVSRGLLSRERGAHGSTFDPVEIERFARRGRRRHPAGSAPEAGSDGRPLGVIDTDIAVIEDGELWFRGLPAAELAGGGRDGFADAGRFDAVVRWLWAGAGEPVPGAPLASTPAAVAVARAVQDALPPAASVFARLLATVSALSSADPERYDLGVEAAPRIAERIVAGLVDAMPVRGAPVPPEAPMAARLWSRLSPWPVTPAGTRMVDAALVLLIDHDIAVSTMAARTAASARSHLYGVVAAGLGAFDSPLHGAASAQVHTLLREAGEDGAEAAVARAARSSGRGVPGFGHALYPDGDPRARVLLALLNGAVTTGAIGDDTGTRASLGVAAEVASYVAERTGQHPNVDFALGALSVAAGMEAEAGETIFAVARSVGWCLHAADEYRSRPMRLRPQGRYIGPPPGGVRIPAPADSPA